MLYTENPEAGSKKQERGNALFLILIAVALFAALAYAITQDGRSAGNGIGKETALVQAGQVVEQPAAVRQAVARMVITGTSINAITFDSGTEHSIFDTAGGGLSALPPPPLACVPACTSWTYVPITSATSGSYVYDVKTEATEALAYLPSLTQEICTQIQKGLGFANSTPLQQIGGVYTGVAGPYDAAGSATTIKGAGTTMDGQEFSCWNNSLSLDPTKYTYYHVLFEQ